jgi:HD-GYP domain-containing protein (c-di-GMP phosphodiesterase class II)
LRHLEIFILDGLGKTYRELGDHQKATSFHELALEYTSKSGDQEGKIDALMGLGSAALGLGDLGTATLNFGAALTLSTELGHAKSAYEAHRLLAEAFEQQGQFEHTITHLKAYHRLEREVLNQETARQTQNLALQLELERAHRDAELYRVRNEAAQNANEMLEQKVKERTQELEEARVEVVMRLALAAEYRDDSTGKHTFRVGHMSALIARELGWADDQIELIRLAARLHDVGKIGISDLIMLKPSKLSPDEFERIKTHTIIGAQMLSGGRSPLLLMAEEIAHSHHERWDGSGYPFGTSGEAIPFSGRIVAVADVFDALISERPYKSAWIAEDAYTEIIRQANAQFDPRVVQAFQKVLETASWADFDATSSEA